ncbi:MAG: hypothetical protein V4481_01870 [Patescibacteria group bacterium]
MSDPSAFGRIIDPIITHIVNPVITLMFGIGLIVFAYGIFEMVWKGGDPSARTTGRYHMLGGLVGMFIMLSAWGLIYLVSNTVKTF